MDNTIRPTDSEQSKRSQPGKSQDGPGNYRSHAQMMENARRSSDEIDAKSITSPELTDLINKRVEELKKEGSSHPEPGKRAKLRALVGYPPKTLQPHFGYAYFFWELSLFPTRKSLLHWAFSIEENTLETEFFES